MSLSSLYEMLVSSDAKLPSSVQQAIASWAQKNPTAETDAVFAALVCRDDLDPEVDSAAESTDRARVKAAWLSRPGRDRSQVEALVNAEKRASVLAAVAASEHTPAELLEVLSRDSRVTVCEGVIANSQATPAALLNALPRLLGKRRSYRTVRSVHDHVDAHPELHDALVKQVDTAAALEPFVGSGRLGVESTAKLIKVLVENPLRQVRDAVVVQNTSFARPNRWGYNELHRTAYGVLTSLEQIRKEPSFDISLLATSGKHWIELREGAGEHFGDLSLQGHEDVDLCLRAAAGETEALQTIAELDELRKELLERARSTGDHLILQKLLIDASNTEDFVVIDAVCANPSFGLDSVPEELGRSEHVRLKMLEVLVASSDPSDSRLAQFAASYLEECSMRKAALDIVAKTPGLLYPALKLAVREAYAWHLSDVVEDETYGAIAVEALSLQQVAEMMRYYPHLANKVDAHVAALLDQVLGTNKKAWEAFHVLSADYDGSFQELALTASALNPEN